MEMVPQGQEELELRPRGHADGHPCNCRLRRDVVGCEAREGGGTHGFMVGCELCSVGY